jgi:CheY-like chemotaxis protein
MESPRDRVIILVVEDDPRVRDLLQSVLTDEGYDVMVAENSEQALTTVATVWPDLITLDLDLPGITGAMGSLNCAAAMRQAIPWCSSFPHAIPSLPTCAIWPRRLSPLFVWFLAEPC